MYTPSTSFFATGRLAKQRIYLIFCKISHMINKHVLYLSPVLGGSHPDNKIHRHYDAVDEPLLMAAHATLCDLNY